MAKNFIGEKLGRPLKLIGVRLCLSEYSHFQKLGDTRKLGVSQFSFQKAFVSKSQKNVYYPSLSSFERFLPPLSICYHLYVVANQSSKQNVNDWKPIKSVTSEGFMSQKNLGRLAKKTIFLVCLPMIVQNLESLSKILWKIPSKNRKMQGNSC